MNHKTTNLQTAAFGVLILVIGAVGGIEQNRLELLPGAIILFALVALAGYLVHKSNEAEEVETLDVFEETGDVVDTIDRQMLQIIELIPEEERPAAIAQAKAIIRKKKAVFDAVTSKTASKKKDINIHPHHTRREGKCQV